MLQQSQPQKFPYDDKFQLGVLKLMVQDPTFLTTHPDVIQPRFFTLDAHMTVATIVMKYFSLYKHPPNDTSISRAEAADYFVKYNTPPPRQRLILETLEQAHSVTLHDRKVIIDRVCHWAKKASLRSGLQDVIDIVNEDGDLDNATDIVRRALTVGSRRTESWSFFEEMTRFNQRLAEDTGYTPGNKIQTGFPSIDRATFMGIGAGQIWTVAARPKGGKSTFMTNIACQALFGNKTVIHYSFGDMSKFDVLMKYTQRLTGRTVQEITGNQFNWQQMVYHLKVSKPDAHLEIYYDSPGVMGVQGLYAHLAYLRSTRGISPDLVVVDYANKMKKELVDNDYRSMGLIYEGLKELGDSFGCGVLTGVQLRRDQVRDSKGNVRDASPDQIAESWLQVADCDVLLIINQQDASELDKNQVRISVPIVRRGSAVNIRCEFIKERATFRELGTY